MMHICAPVYIAIDTKVDVRHFMYDQIVSIIMSCDMAVIEDFQMTNRINSNFITYKYSIDFTLKSEGCRDGTDPQNTHTRLWL